VLRLQVNEQLQARGGVDGTSISGIVVVEVVESQSRVGRSHDTRKVLPAEVNIGILGKGSRDGIVVATVDDPLDGAILGDFVRGEQMSRVDKVAIIQRLNAVDVKVVPRDGSRVRGTIEHLMRSREWNLRKMITTAPCEEDFVGGDVDLVEYAVQNPAVLGTSNRGQIGLCSVVCTCDDGALVGEVRFVLVVVAARVDALDAGVDLEDCVWHADIGNSLVGLVKHSHRAVTVAEGGKRVAVPVSENRLVVQLCLAKVLIVVGT